MELRKWIANGRVVVFVILTNSFYLHVTLSMQIHKSSTIASTATFVLPCNELLAMCKKILTNYNQYSLVCLQKKVCCIRFEGLNDFYALYLWWINSKQFWFDNFLLSQKRPFINHAYQSHSYLETMNNKIDVICRLSTFTKTQSCMCVVPVTYDELCTDKMQTYCYWSNEGVNIQLMQYCLDYSLRLSFYGCWLLSLM